MRDRGPGIRGCGGFQSLEAFAVDVLSADVRDKFACHSLSPSLVNRQKNTLTAWAIRAWVVRNCLNGTIEAPQRQALLERHFPDKDLGTEPAECISTSLASCRIIVQGEQHLAFGTDSLDNQPFLLRAHRAA